MSDFLVKHAINNVWCNPKQDTQMILKPARLTPYGGVVRSWKFLWTSFNLPNNSNRFHIYSIGQIHPLLVNLLPVSNTWKLVSESNMATDTLTEIYTQKGIRLPISQVHYIYTEENSLLFAVKKDNRLNWDFNNEDIYIRLYDNAYFESNRHEGPGIYIRGMTIGTTSDTLSIQADYLEKNALPGKVYCFINGYKVKDLSLINITIGDAVEFYYDPSVIGTYEFKLDSLEVFDSILDSKRKYLLHPGAGLGDDIYYQDDIDIYIKNGVTKKGVYFHKNSVDNLRMVTHKDYSISQSVISAFLNEHGDIFDYSTAVIELNIRESGYDRSLVDENSRIKELYKLSDLEIKSAFIGAESSLDVWRVDNLENSKYTKVMRSGFSEVTKSLVKDAYGYNAVVKLAATPVVKTEVFNSQIVGRMPYKYLLNSTVYEFDQNGLYVSNQHHVGGEIYNCQNTDASYLMIIHGEGGDTLDEYYNAQFVNLDSNYDYRFYAAIKDDVYPYTNWVDVTATDSYVVQNGQVIWSITDTHDVLIRSNKKHLSKSFYLDPLGGSLTFNISHVQNIDGVMVDAIMQIPMGELKVYLNGRSLVRGLDYHVDFPVVTIVNKDYLVDQNTTQQKIDYVFTGLCSSELEFSTYVEKGFIRNGYLSVDSRFDIRDDKAIFIIANGRIYTRDDLNFVEDSHEFVFNSVLNGKPYCIEDAIVPIKDLTNTDTYEYKALSTDIDNAVSGYLTLRMPKPDVPLINPISQYYKLYSPFISKVIFSVLDNAIDPQALKVQYNDDTVRSLVGPYLYLLDMDPIHPDNNPDRNYCIIHPHVLSNIVEVDIYQYKFITRVVNIYGNGLINLSGHLIMV